MPTPKLVTITAWSYSRYNDYVKCPALAKYKHVLRIPEPSNPAMERGGVIDQLAADYALKKLPATPVPAELARFAEEFKLLRREKSLVAQAEWAFTATFDPCGWKDWGRAWVRIKTDLHYLTGRGKACVVIDVKTGREYPEHKKQLSLYALGAFLTYPNVERVTVADWYVDQGTIGGPEAWERNQLDALKLEWIKATKRLLSDTAFAPTPGPQCRYCFYRKDNAANGGGQCKF